MPVCLVPRPSRTARLVLASLAATAAVGAGATVGILARTGAGWPGPSALAAAGLVVVSTAINLLLRFWRARHLMRRLAVRPPLVPELGAWVGSCAFLPVPLFAGQVIARVRLLAGIVDPARVVFGFVWERLLDVWALAVLAALGLSPRAAVVSLVGAAVLVVPGVGGLLARPALAVTGYLARVLGHEGAPLAPVAVRAASRAGTVATSAGLSLAAWGVTACAVLPLVRSAGPPDLGPAAAVGVAAGATLAGALSLVPLGAGVAGTLLTAGLGGLGLAPEGAAEVTLLFRGGTVWFTVALGAIGLLLLRARGATGHAHDHFDAIHECYDAWLPPHYREHLVAKKTAPILARLGPSIVRARGLDVGCGRGWYAHALGAAGAAMVGVDMSRRQLEAAGAYLGSETPLVQASVLALPFRRPVFDFAYVVNVLHHLPSPRHQVEAIAAIGAALRPGGFLFVHEMNVANPLFRFYLAYLFPILKGIEEGTEHYFDPRRMPEVPGLRLVAVDTMTFVPDFVPAWALRPAAAVERWLERGPLARFGAHLVAVYERVAA